MVGEATRLIQLHGIEALSVVDGWAQSATLTFDDARSSIVQIADEIRQRLCTPVVAAPIEL
ncbi:hypothetical protein GCM10011380_32840 [Sphingomonas metalli]|uniref:Uncharacterized protein n=2 Tax=Sphingomonas metalli TaxID=1779358 RepID=A0A916WX46_9SPHN|nr:hypothetical protein GCM10011380_32840 [Sphingomonas metalli]